MATWFWVCRGGCAWNDSEDYQEAVERNGARGRLRDIGQYNTRITLDIHDAFCIVGLGLSEMSTDLTSADFLLEGANAANLCMYGHKAGFTDLYYLAVVYEGSLTDQGTRPKSWKPRGVRKAGYSFADFRTVIQNW
jgi:hypothetical protein